MPSQSWNSAGTYSWTCPPNVYAVTAELNAAGGGGGAGADADSFNGTGGGGGGGGYISGLTAVTPNHVYTVVVGAGGAGGAALSQSNGSPGGNSTFAGDVGNLTAFGGGGGDFPPDQNNGGSGGSGGGSTFGGGVSGLTNINGGNGQDGPVYFGGGAGGQGGDGGNAPGTGGSGDGSQPGGGGGGGGNRPGGGSDGSPGGDGGVTLTWTPVYSVSTAAHAPLEALKSSRVSRPLLLVTTTSLSNTTHLPSSFVTSVSVDTTACFLADTFTTPSPKSVPCAVYSFLVRLTGTGSGRIVANIHVNDVGVAFQGTAMDQNGNIVPLDTGDTTFVLFQLPDQSSLTKQGTIVNAPSGTFQYVTVSGDLSQNGTWKVQGYVSHSGGQWYGDEVKFKVLPNILQVN